MRKPLDALFAGLMLGGVLTVAGMVVVALYRLADRYVVDRHAGWVTFGIVAVFLAWVVIAAICGGGRVAAGGVGEPGGAGEDTPAAALWPGVDDGVSLPTVVEREPEDVLLNDQVREMNRRQP